MGKLCQNCHQSNPSEAAFCHNCASSLSSGQFGGHQSANQQWNQSGYGGQPAQNFAAPLAVNSGEASQRATIALVLAIAGLVCCGPLTSIPAIIVGWMEVAAIKQGQSPQAGMKFAQIGLWGGVAVTILQVFAFLFWIILSMAAAGSDPSYY